jgi:NAD(P)-dependent dehydrogenase (short-subunit alcohol dehydrogenase family)
VAGPEGALRSRQPRSNDANSVRRLSFVCANRSTGMAPVCPLPVDAAKVVLPVLLISGIFRARRERLSVEHMSDIILITGANKGIGREAARRLHELGHTVVIGARDPERGRAAADELRVAFVQLDVTDQASVDDAAEHVRATYGRLDVLVNNAGITGTFAPLERTTGAEAQAVLDTNVLGVLRVTNAFVPLLQQSEHARVVNVSSGVSSLHDTIENGYFDWQIIPPIYAMSKTALNMLTVKYSRALPSMRVNAADPGYTRTDLNGGNGAHDVTEGTDEIVRLATISSDGPTGTVSSSAGPLSW